jgi:multiple sugar transport system permease protein
VVARAAGGAGLSARAARPRAHAGLLFAGPALGAIALFFVLPVAAALLLSVTDFDLYALADLGSLRFVGLANYARLLADPAFWTALANTLYFAGVGGTLSVLTSLGGALLLQAPLARARGLFRTIYFLPVVTTLVAVAIVWRFLYHPRIGLLNRALEALGLPGQDWLGDPTLAMPALILLSIWKNFGFNLVIFAAALQAIPERLYEAARLDGATGLQQLRHVTLPMLRPTTGFVVLMTAIGSLQLFAEPYVMTQGGPGDATRSLVLLMYEQGFRWWNLGFAAAVAFVLFALVAVATAVARRLFGVSLIGAGRAP